MKYQSYILVIKFYKNIKNILSRREASYTKTKFYHKTVVILTSSRWTNYFKWTNRSQQAEAITGMCETKSI